MTLIASGYVVYILLSELNNSRVDQYKAALQAGKPDEVTAACRPLTLK